MKKFLTVLLVLVMVFSLAACNSDPKAPDEDIQMQYMTADELKSKLAEGDESILVVDVRKAADYEASHIPGAVSIDMDAAKEGDFEAGVAAMQAGLTEYAGDEKGGDKTLVLVCYSGARYAQASTNVLYAIGAEMDNVYTLEGGFNNWSTVNADIVTGGEEVTDVQMKYIKDADLKAKLDNKDESILVLDVRKAEDYAAGHIPGAISIDMDAAKEGDYAAGLTSMKLGLLKATGEVDGGDKTLVLVCYSGARYAQASTNVLAAYGVDTAARVLTLEGGFNNWSTVYADAVEK